MIGTKELALLNCLRAMNGMPEAIGAQDPSIWDPPEPTGFAYYAPPGAFWHRAAWHCLEPR